MHLKLAKSEVALLRRRLLEWFRRTQRPLPWRRTRDPYRIWLSEIMLQQTRVAAVLPYYCRFVRQFPNVRALARARPDAVLRLWAGLGYYSRARNLHQAAREIAARHGGQFPREPEAALALPGIGAYTAAAVLSIAYGEPYAVLDGNVARVLARLGAMPGAVRAPRRWKELQQLAQALLDPRAAGDWNQAMMELGATVCTPKSPRCEVCPIARCCRAYQLGIAEDLPSPRRKRPPVRVTLAAAVLLDSRGRTLLVRDPRGDAGQFFSRMWQFPSIRVNSDAKRELLHYLRASFSGLASLAASGLMPLARARHTVTFRKITLLPFLCTIGRLPRVAGTRRLPLARLDHLPIASATRKVAAAALAHRRLPD